jgi:hypothetical protein
MMALLLTLMPLAQAVPTAAPTPAPTTVPTTAPMTATTTAPTLPAAGVSPSLVVESELVLKVYERDRCADALVAAAETAGGYFSERRDDMVVLRVPVDAAASIQKTAEGLGLVLTRSEKARDVTVELLELRTRLESSEQVLQRYYEVIAQSSIQAVVTVERSMTEQVQHIEALRGRIQKLEHQVTFAQIIVRFSLHERQAPARTGTSSFAWLNSVNLTDVLAEVDHVK